MRPRPRLLMQPVVLLNVANQLTVVVVALNPVDRLTRCLEALEALDDDELDVIVVRDWKPRAGPVPPLTTRFRSVRWIAAPEGSTVPTMRQLGIDASIGERVALIEDDCFVQAGWSLAVRQQLTGSASAVGGPVEPGDYGSMRDWAIYFCEYGRFMRPLPERQTADLPGMNVAYLRSRLASLDRRSDGFADWFVHAEWAKAGVDLRTCDNFVVKNLNSWPADYVTSTPYHHGRAFAGRRFAHLAWWQRAAYAGGAFVLLPWVKTARIAAIVFARRRYRRQFLGALPWVLLFNASWSYGEAVGCLSGPGLSPSRWRGRTEER